MLATINGGPLADGKHTLTLIATDSNGNLVSAGDGELHPDHDPAGPGDAGSSWPRATPGSATATASRGSRRRPSRSPPRPAAIVRLYADGNQVGQATANNGPVFITTTALSPGSHQITATAEDVAGNVSTAAAPVTVVIRTTPPTTPTLGLDAASQTVAGPADRDEQADRQPDRHDQPPARTSPSIAQFDPNTPIMKTQADVERQLHVQQRRPGPGHAGIHGGGERRGGQQQPAHPDDHDNGQRHERPGHHRRAGQRHGHLQHRRHHLRPDDHGGRR